MKVSIVVPHGLTEEAVEHNMKHAACAHAPQMGAVAIAAFGEGDSLESGYTAGNLDFAPNGRWSEADPSVPWGTWKAGEVRVRDIYLNPPPPGHPVGSKVILATDEDGTTVFVSSEADAWGEDQEVASVAIGTSGSILEVSELDLGETRVKLDDEGKTTDWVHDWDLRLDPGEP